MSAAKRGFWLDVRESWQLVLVGNRRWRVCTRAPAAIPFWRFESSVEGASKSDGAGSERFRWTPGICRCVRSFLSHISLHRYMLSPIPF